MPEESTFRKYACPKLKLSRLLLDNLFRILVQNLSALEELNSRKHTPSPTVWFLRNCGIAQNSSCRIAQNLSFAKTEKGNFARNDFCEWLRKLLFFFSRKTDAQRKKNFAFRSANSFANGNPTRSKQQLKVFIIQRQNLMNLNRQPGKIVCWLKFWKLNQPCLNHKDSLNLVSDFLTLG